MGKLRSRIIERGKVNWGKNLVIDKLFFDFDAFHKKMFVDNLKLAKPHLTPEEIEEACAKEVIDENMQILAMDEISAAYKIELDQEDIAERIEEVRKEFEKMNQQGANLLSTEENLVGRARILVYKDVIFSDLSQYWGIKVSALETRLFLEDYCRRTNGNIEEYTKDPKVLEKIRKDLQDFQVAKKIKASFTATVTVEKYRKYWEKMQKEEKQGKH